MNKEKFLEWYRSAARAPLGEQQVLKKLFEDYCHTGKSLFVLSGEESLSGNEESYPYRLENIGCCGASTVYIYF